MKVVIHHVPIRPRPEIPIRRARIRPLIERNALLTLENDIAENVLVVAPRRPTHAASELLVPRPGIVEPVRHGDVGQTLVLEDGKITRQWDEVELLPVERALNKKTPPARA